MKKVTTALLGAMLLLPPSRLTPKKRTSSSRTTDSRKTGVIAHPGQLATIKKQTVQLLSPGAYPKS